MTSDFIGRESDLSILWETLERRSVLLTGPRRVGKTALLREIAQRPREGWLAVRVDLEGESTARAAVGLIHRALTQRGLLGGEARRGLTEVAARVESVEALGLGASLRATGEVEPWVALRQLLNSASSGLDMDVRLVLALDELPWWLDGIVRADGADAARTALAQLRRIRQDDDLRERLRFIHTGSVGLAGLAHDVGASAEINDITPAQELRPLGFEAGAALFEGGVAGHGVRAQASACTRAWQLAGGLPHWIKELAQRTRAEPDQEIGVADVERAVEELMQPRMRNLFEDEGTEHLRRRYTAEDHAAVVAILDAAASASFTTEETLIAAALSASAGRDRRSALDLLFRLSDAYYLDRDASGTWKFLVPLFQLWWQRFGGA